MTHSSLDAALFYVSIGWKVVPILANSKLPASSHAVKDASNDPVQIKEWFGSHPDWNIAIAAGADSGISVIDIDPRNGGDDSFSEWKAQHGELPDGAMQLTAGGGEHYVVTYDPDIRSRKMAQGIDYLSDGKYFLVYPSKIEGRTYQWEWSFDPFDGVGPSSLPQQYKAALLSGKTEAKSTGSGDLIVGNRNNGLTSLAGSMRATGMGAAEIHAALCVTNDMRCDPPLPASELRQIVDSVCRYEPNGDVAGDTAIGSIAADSLLRQESKGDYFLTRADSFLGQPSPLPWVIKGWLPAGSTAMIFGESGVGKTFVAIDIACCVASGIDWCNIKTKQGTVVYLAGEGNYGLRQRITSWAIDRDNTNLRSLLISNKPIDMDARGSADLIISAIRELTKEDVSLVFVDTVNNHMSGDENSAQDTRKMLNACHTVALATGATIVLVHHTGVSDGAQERARGSSAWKGALDSSILVSKPPKGTDIKVTCTKMKDAQRPEPLSGALTPVELGWTDDDGEPISGACFQFKEPIEGEEDSQPYDYNRESKITRYCKIFTNAWARTGYEVKDGAPYVSKSGMITHLIESTFVSRTTAQKYITADGRIICDMILAELIKPIDFGWVATDKALISQMNLSKPNG